MSARAAAVATRAPVTLAELAELVHGELTSPNDADVTVDDVAVDHRSVRNRALFGAILGARFDGHDFAAQAVERGAVALLAQRRVEGLAVPTILVDSVRRAVGPVAHRVHGSPSHQLTLVGVTGTSGKTTVTHLVAQMLRALGCRCSLAGTLSGPRTTAEAPDVCRWLATVLTGEPGSLASDPVAVMEVSSHGLEMGRVDGLAFRVAAFLNLDADHLDFHQDTEHYYRAKAKLFDDRTAIAVVNLDDPSGRRLAHEVGAPHVRTFRAADVTDVASSRAGLKMRWAGHEVTTSVIGRHNVANFAATGAIGRALGLSDDDIAAGLCATAPVPGRMEVVSSAQRPDARAQEPFVLVDYAHKPDALRAVLVSSREIARASGGNLSVVFGAGGDRDVTKRPQMGRIAAELADTVTITTDNPRSEDPSVIALAVRAGADEAARSSDSCVVNEIADRRDAIVAAIGAACANDVVVIAGKGHEESQEFAAHSTPFSDVQVARDALADWRSAS